MAISATRERNSLNKVDGCLVYVCVGEMEKRKYNTSS
jgi:hypothetical protein